MNEVVNREGVFAGNNIDGDLTVDVPHGEVVIKNVKIAGDLIVKNAARIYFSGSAEKIRVLSDNTDVYAFSDEAEFAESVVSGTGSSIVTKRYCDYQNVAWEDKKAVLPSGTGIAYAVCGPAGGTPVVMIHGLTDGRVTWSQVAPALAEKGYRVYVPEYKGNGKSDKPYGDEDAYSVSALTADIASLMDVLGIESAHIVGHSLGSIISQELNMSYRDKVRTTTLIASGVKIDSESETMDWFLNGDGDYKGIFAYEDTKKLPESFIESWGENSNPDENFRAANFEHLRQIPYYVWKALTNNLLKLDNTSRLGGITGSVQIIWGSEDGIFPRNQQDILLSGMVNADVTFHEMTGADHNTHWARDNYEAVDTVAGYIDEFIKENS